MVHMSSPCVCVTEFITQLIGVESWAFVLSRGKRIEIGMGNCKINADLYSKESIFEKLNLLKKIECMFFEAGLMPK